MGRKLTLRVEEVMVEEGYPSLGEDALMRDCIVPLAEMRGVARGAKRKGLREKKDRL